MERNEIIWMVIALIAVAGFLVMAYGASGLYKDDIKACADYVHSNCQCNAEGQIYISRMGESIPYNISGVPSGT